MRRNGRNLIRDAELQTMLTVKQSVGRSRSRLSRPGRMSWVRLLKRVFEVELQNCPDCVGKLNRRGRACRCIARSALGMGSTVSFRVTIFALVLLQRVDSTTSIP